MNLGVASVPLAACSAVWADSTVSSDVFLLNGLHAPETKDCPACFSGLSMFVGGQGLNLSFMKLTLS